MCSKLYGSPDIEYAYLECVRKTQVEGLREYGTMGPFHEQSYKCVYTIVNKSSSRRTIVLHLKGNQSQYTIVIGLYTTVHEMGPRSFTPPPLYGINV